MSTITVSAVAVPAMSEVRTMFVDSARAIAVRERQRKRVAAYVGGSLAVHLAAILFLQAMPVEENVAAIVLTSTEVTSTSSASATNEMTPDEPEQATASDAGQDGAGSVAMALQQGAAGKPDAPAGGGMQIQKTREAPAMSRQQAIEYARSAGFMGNVRAMTNAIGSLAGEQDYTSGFDSASFYGPIVGSAGDGRGNFGMGREGFGPGGGCLGGDCGTIPGNSRYNTVPGFGGGHGPYGPGNGHGGLRTRTGIVPKDMIGQPQVVDGGLDKKTIRRYIKQNTFKISYCYEHELLSRPDLQGNVMVSFLITGSGVVQVSSGSGFDGKVASCVANVVKNIQFPAPKNGGNVQVNYPFSFRRSGQ